MKVNVVPSPVKLVPFLQASIMTVALIVTVAALLWPPPKKGCFKFIFIFPGGSQSIQLQIEILS